MEGYKAMNIPSDEDFARASRRMEEQFRNLDLVEKNVIEHFKALCPLHELALLPFGDTGFQVYIFYEENKDIEACKRSGVTQAILDDLYKELEQAGRGSRDSITVRVEVDSHENVVAKFQGNYDRRLH